MIPEKKVGCGVEIPSHRPRRPSPSHGDEGTGDGVTEKRKTERQRGREAERQRGREAERQRGREAEREEVEATERDASSNRNVKGGEEARLGTRSVRPGYEIRNVINVKNYQYGKSEQQAFEKDPEEEADEAADESHDVGPYRFYFVETEGNDTYRAYDRKP